jgi:hypothetical protein
MKYLDFTTLFDTEPASLAVLSTFQLDADFFERRLLRCPALSKARRILIFMDAGQWHNLLGRDVVARSLNRRYLVVPVRRHNGVFHPKLNLLASEQVGQLQCGSNNLTRAGCSSNLELLNSFRFDLESWCEGTLRLFQDALAFYKRACDDAEELTGRIACEWLDELPKLAPWLSVSVSPSDSRPVRLVHTYQGSLWDRLSAVLDTAPPKHLLVVSPYYDLDAEMVRRVHERWPKCKIELVVQQKTTTLPVSSLKGLKPYVALSELRSSSRRLHAKLVTWESDTGSGCLVGSANFTTAAFDARNVEACLLLEDANEAAAKLFDDQFVKSPIAFEGFDPGTDKEPEEIDSETAIIRLISGLLTHDGQLQVRYQHRLEPKPDSLRVAVRTMGEPRPRAFVGVPNTVNGSACILLPEVCLADVHGTLLASLVAEVGERRCESPPVWVIQAARLTYESSDGSSSPKRNVEETGAGLTELLEELAKRQGAAAVIEYLRHLNIRFSTGGGGFHGPRKFRLRIRDPFRPDLAPEWLVTLGTNTTSLEKAIYEFVDRHEQQRLRRHARKGNINGAENFLDILTALVRLLYVYHMRGVVPQGQLVGRLVNYLGVATCGIDTSADSSEGYLDNVYDNLSGDSDYLQEVCSDLNLLGHLWAALVIAKRVRFIPNEKSEYYVPPKRPSECLPHIRKKLTDTMGELGLDSPSHQQVKRALEEYNMFSPTELGEMEGEIVI